MTNQLIEEVGLEASLLKLLMVRKNYDDYIDHIVSKSLLPTTAILLKDYKKYYNLYPDHKAIDFGLLYTQFSQDWHSCDMSEFDMTYYKDKVFPTILNAEDAQVDNLVLALIKRKTAAELKTATEQMDFNTIQTVIESHQKRVEAINGRDVDEDAVTAESVDLNDLDKSHGIPHCLTELQNSLGGLVKGEFTVVSAATNAGKSAYCISQAVVALKHLQQKNDNSPVLYFNSEGTASDLFVRVWSNLYRDKYKDGFEQLTKSLEDVRGLFLKEFKDKFIAFQIGTHRLNFIENKIKKYNPALVLIDMMDSLSEAEDNLTLKKLYDNVRRLSLEHCPIIGTTQAGMLEYYDESTHQNKTKKFLGIKDVLNCKAKVAAATTFIGIGQDYEHPGLRFISTPKIKRGEPLKFTCELKNQFSLYHSLEW